MGGRDTRPMLDIRSLGTCPNEDTPNKIGRLKVYPADFCGGHVEFKYPDVTSERMAGGEVRYDIEGYDHMFRQDVGHVCERFQSYNAGGSTATHQ